MKKIIAIVLACVMASSLICIGVSANSANKAESKITEQMTTEEIAHLDLASADAVTQDAILAARSKIIFSREWVADGYSAYVADANGNIKRTLPTFSEVFPDWELPKTQRNSDPTTQPTLIGCDINDINAARNAEQNSSRGLSDWLHLGGIDAYVPEATDQQAEDFAVLYTDLYDVGTSVATVVSELTSSETCNIGYSNYITGEPLTYFTNLSLYDHAIIDYVGDMYLGIRASTYSYPGWAYFDIFGANRLGYIK